MNTYIKQAITSTAFLRISACILGFLFWSIIADSFSSYIWVTVPIAFYNNVSGTLTSPETATIKLQGKRSLLKRLQACELAVHIDAQTLKLGRNQIDISPDLLMLPHSITIEEALPATLIITVETSTKQSVEQESSGEQEQRLTHLNKNQ